MAHVRKQRCIDGRLTPPPRRGKLDVASPASSESACVDELLEWIENSDPNARFVPDLAGESYKNAA
ncbi:MAG: hypothetical protein ACM3JC_12540 [Rudaea sp.]